MFRYSTIVSVLMAFGCAATSTVPRVSKNPQRPALGRPATAPPAAAGDVPAEPPAVLRLYDAVAVALVRSPELSTYSWQVRADEARMIQAGLRPNPEARLYAEDFVGTGRFKDGGAAQIDTAPEIVRDLAERQLRETEVRLADAYRVPTPVVSLGVRRLQQSSAEAMVFGVSVPLPFSDRNQGNRTAARALLAKRARMLASRPTSGSGRRSSRCVQELLHASTALDSLEKEILPQAETSLALSRGGFLEGRFTYLDLADAERTLVPLKKERIDTAASYHQLAIDIEPLTGQPIVGASDKPVQP